MSERGKAMAKKAVVVKPAVKLVGDVAAVELVVAPHEHEFRYRGVEGLASPLNALCACGVWHQAYRRGNKAG